MYVAVLQLHNNVLPVVIPYLLYVEEIYCLPKIKPKIEIHIKNAIYSCGDLLQYCILRSCYICLGS